MSNVLDCMQCKYLSSLDITIDNMKSNKMSIERDCGKDVKETIYIVVELNPKIKQKISCKEFKRSEV